MQAQKSSLSSFLPRVFPHSGEMFYNKGRHADKNKAVMLNLIQHLPRMPWLLIKINKSAVMLNLIQHLPRMPWLSIKINKSAVMLNLIQHLPRMPWPLRNGKRQTANNRAWKIPNQVWNDLFIISLLLWVTFYNISVCKPLST